MGFSPLLNIRVHWLGDAERFHKFWCLFFWFKQLCITVVQLCFTGQSVACMRYTALCYDFYWTIMLNELWNQLLGDRKMGIVSFTYLHLKSIMVNSKFRDSHIFMWSVQLNQLKPPRSCKWVTHLVSFMNVM